eukprot:scaffold17_cov187-Ochromonas_danica.AAC.6
MQCVEGVTVMISDKLSDCWLIQQNLNNFNSSLPAYQSQSQMSWCRVSDQLYLVRAQSKSSEMREVFSQYSLLIFKLSSNAFTNISYFSVAIWATSSIGRAYA